MSSMRKICIRLLVLLYMDASRPLMQHIFWQKSWEFGCDVMKLCYQLLMLSPAPRQYYQQVRGVLAQPTKGERLCKTQLPATSEVHLITSMWLPALRAVCSPSAECRGAQFHKLPLVHQCCTTPEMNPPCTTSFSGHSDTPLPAAFQITYDQNGSPHQTELNWIALEEAGVRKRGYGRKLPGRWIPVCQYGWF